MPSEPGRISAFDFDGTLTFKDSFISFLFDSFGIFGVSLQLLMKPGLLVDYARTRDRGALKSRLLFALMAP